MVAPTADESAWIAEVFADMICSDPDWLDAEFEAIVADFWKMPKTAAGSSWAPDSAPAGPGAGASQNVTGGGCVPSLVATPIRSPPAHDPCPARALRPTTESR